MAPEGAILTGGLVVLVTGIAAFAISRARAGRRQAEAALQATTQRTEAQVRALGLQLSESESRLRDNERLLQEMVQERHSADADQAQLRGALQAAYDDLQRTQQAVMQQERLRALGEMASGAAHNINNAISPIMLYSESLLESEPGLSGRARDYLQTIRRASGDVALMVTRMREFHRPREAQTAPAAVSLNDLAHQAADLTRARWADLPQQRGAVVRMRMELEEDLPAVDGVPGDIREALINLIFNAVDAMPTGGTLTLRTRHAPPDEGEGPASAIIEVTDTGIGMDEDTRRRCLEPFFTTKGERGSGLGLAMVYGVVEQSGARIAIESAPGLGTTVKLAFPQSSTSVAVPMAAAQSSLRILIVDDDPLLLKSLRDTLEGDGHSIVTASGGREGIEMFRSALESGREFAVVITDLGMPYVDGRQVAAAVKEAADATRVVMLTGWGQRLASRGEIPANVDRLLSKPPRLRELREALA